MPMRAHAAFASALLLCLLPGCAQFELYDKDNKEIKGFKYYTSKPYVLVGRTGKSDTPFSITHIYLPDLDNPVYAKASPGWLGSSVLKMEFNDNGTLKSFGQEGNNNISDLVNQLGGFAKNLAEAQVARSKSDAPGEPLTPAEGKSIAQILDRAQISANRGLDSARMGSKEREAFNASTETLALTAKDLANPSIAPDRQAVTERLRDVIAGWQAQARTLEAGKGNEVNARLAEATALVSAAIRRVRAGDAADAHFSLYEVMDGATPWLREVAFDPPARRK